MRTALPRIFGRFGFVCALLLALAMTALPIEGQAFADSGDTPATASTICTEACDLDDCGDCAAVCTHGCCHAAHVGIPASLPAATALAEAPVVNSLPPAAPPSLSSASGLDRPPRA